MLATNARSEIIRPGAVTTGPNPASSSLISFVAWENAKDDDHRFFVAKQDPPVSNPKAKQRRIDPREPAHIATSPGKSLNRRTDA